VRISWIHKESNVSDLKKLVEGRRLKLGALSRAHALAADRLSQWHFWLGVPVVILTTIVGTAAFAALSDLGKTTFLLTLIAGVLSILAAILSALQTFLDFQGRSQKHSSAASKLNALDRRFERALFQKSPEIAVQYVEIVDDELSKIIQEAPRVSVKAQELAVTKMRLDLVSAQLGEGRAISLRNLKKILPFRYSA
jgi:hypothetical protein